MENLKSIEAVTEDIRKFIERTLKNEYPVCSCPIKEQMMQDRRDKVKFNIEVMFRQIKVDGPTQYK